MLVTLEEEDDGVSCDAVAERYLLDRLCESGGVGDHKHCEVSDLAAVAIQALQ